MKYTLAQNGISSLTIAIENFKKFFYYDDKYSQSEINEAVKICVVFLENSIELLLKTILVSTDPLSIYIHPNSRTMRKAMQKVTDSVKLEDILIFEGRFQTISYSETLKKYSEKYCHSQKVLTILGTLGEKRNAITHFGIGDKFEDVLICILNTFDVIYNYLYPELINIDDIDKYFTSDDINVETIHGKKFLFDDDYIYNNILDFLDELIEESKSYICTLRATDSCSRISEFTKIMKNLLEDKKLIYILEQHYATIEFSSCNFDDNEFYFDIFINSEQWDNIGSCYSPFFNVTAFCGETGKVYFLVDHNKNHLYVYNKFHRVWTAHDEPEPDYQWLEDEEKGICKRYNLSKRNLLLAFSNMLETL